MTKFTFILFLLLITNSLFAGTRRFSVVLGQNFSLMDGYNENIRGGLTFGLNLNKYLNNNLYLEYGLLVIKRKMELESAKILIMSGSQYPMEGYISDISISQLYLDIPLSINKTLYTKNSIKFTVSSGIGLLISLNEGSTRNIHEFVDINNRKDFDFKRFEGTADKHFSENSGLCVNFGFRLENIKFFIKTTYSFSTYAMQRARNININRKVNTFYVYFGYTL